ncbi:hypothetical protein [Sporocytophaga myxococcoides]|uniref:hypothetical protein n=1 Tax=Sporocytophaga myxococcoides TaxID=153721 RepID=UPI00042A663E|nr:hypothetical protein [Sporocytophaga myxococcoides]
MKDLLCILGSVILLTNCSNSNTSTIEKESNQLDSLKQKFVPILNGVWVLTDYINSIEQTKSPVKSSNKLRGVVTMIIDETINSDSIDVGSSWNNHEGYNFITYFQTGQNNNSLKTNIPDYEEISSFYELGYETINNQTSLVLYHYDKTKKLIDKKSFTKVANKQSDNDAAWGLQYIVNKKLFAGNYLLIDSTNSFTKVSLKSDGSFSGHSDFKTYYVFTDFMGGPETSLDEIDFNFYTKNSKGFAFKIVSDTTYLYSTIGDEETGEPEQLDKIQYKLVRQ